MIELEKCRLEIAFSDFWFTDPRNKTFIKNKIMSRYVYDKPFGLFKNE